MSRYFDPKKIIDYSLNYYEILGVEKESLPEPEDRPTKVKLSALLNKAYRERAKFVHPDLGGDPKDFKLLVRAHTIISDPILKKMYDSGGTYIPPIIAEGYQSGFEVDWDKIGTYRQGTTADTVGFSLFLKLSNYAKEHPSLNLIPAFYPSDETHNYEWDWVIDENKNKLSLSIIYDEDNILKLTSGNDIQNSLPFKIYFCIPRASLHFLRTKPEEYELEQGQTVILNGKLNAVIYSDYDLLETTLLSDAHSFIESPQGLQKHLDDFRSGVLQERQSKIDLATIQANWISSDQMNKMDDETLKALMRMKTFEGQHDAKAADFIETIPDN